MAKPKIKRGPNKDLDSRAYLDICSLLFNNELSPGQKISYNHLAARLGVSITPVIHALKMLELKGIVRHEPNKGYFTNQISVQEITEIYETRLLLEVALLDISSGQTDRPGLVRLAQAMDKFDDAVAEKNFQKRMMTDRDVHLTLASLSGREIQLQVLRDLFDRLLLKYSTSLTLFSMMDTSSRDHWEIFKVLEKGDGRQAGELLTGHLTRTKIQIEQGLARLINSNEEAFAGYS